MKKMNDDQLLELLKTSVNGFNEYRQEYPDQKIDFSYRNLKGVNFFRASLHKVNFRGSNLKRAYLVWANFYKADFQDACLRGAELGGVNLQHTNFEGADLQRACLQGADLINSNLQYSDLTGSDLRYANFDEADLFRAKVANANFGEEKE